MALVGCEGADDDTDDPGTEADTTEDMDSDTVEADTEVDSDSTGSELASAPPGAFQQPRVGAASGVMTSDSHTMVFSLGGQAPPATGSAHIINSPPTEESP